VANRKLWFSSLVGPESGRLPVRTVHPMPPWRIYLSVEVARAVAPPIRSPMKTTYQIDPAHSGVHFSIRHLMIATVRGSFSGLKGTVVQDPDDPSATTLEAEVDVNTINTNDEKRDGHLKSPDFFDTEQYPVMTYKSTKVTAGDGADFTIIGDLTLHGVTKPVTLNVEEVSEEITDPWGKARIGATAKGKLKRTDFGLSWNAALEAGGAMLGDEVKIEFDIQLVKA
jgi:polyisoprenoid-binding protein YceI